MSRRVPGPHDPARRRRETRRLIDQLRPFGPEILERNRRYLAERTLALAASLARDDLDALSLDELNDLWALLASARGSGPPLVA